MERLVDEKLYYVGGIVRDEFLGISSLDTDYCYEGDAIEFAKDNNLQIIRENPDFGTVRVLFYGKEIDIASTRTETYPKAGHLPKVADIGCPLHLDLARRDFTINAIAKNTLTNEIIDVFNGLEDIKGKRLKVLHKNSFIDDPTRIIRGLKFAIRFGFELDEETEKLQQEYLSNINYDMSYHRLKKELIEAFSIDKEEVFEKFINQKMYKLLNENQILPQDFEIPNIKLNANENWIKYLAKFDLSNFELTRKERQLLKTIQ